MTDAIIFAAVRKIVRRHSKNPLEPLVQVDVDELNAALAEARSAAEAPQTPGNIGSAAGGHPGGPDAPVQAGGLGAVLHTDLSDPDKFFDSVRQQFGGLSQEQVEGIEAILAEMGRAGWPLAWTAYGVATPWHETGRVMKPNVESLNYSVGGLLQTFGRHRITAEQARAFGRGAGPANQEAIANTVYGGSWGEANLGNRQPGDGWKYRGRGLDHTTGRANYTKVDKVLGLNGALVENPDILLQLDNAVKSLVTGMEAGRYTGKKLADTLPHSGRANFTAFRQSRPIINAMDKADEIAGHAMKFQTALEAGGWS